MRKIIFLLSALSTMFLFSLQSAHAEVSSFGSDEDIHNCVYASGYTWSAPLWKCIRSWDYYTMRTDTPSTGVLALDTLLQARVNRITKMFRQSAETLTKESGVIDPEKYNLDVSYTMAQTGVIVSVLMQTDIDLGGAQISTDLHTYTYDTRLEKNIALLRVFTRKELVTISKNIETSLRTSLGAEADVNWIRAGLSPRKLSNYSRFTVKTDMSGNITSVTFYFKGYQVGPYSIGTPMVTVSVPSLTVIPNP